MVRLFAVFSLVLMLVVSGYIIPSRADETSTETLLFIRHGEKPAAGLGQLSCKGLNRALALPAVIAAKYGRLDGVFAPDPSQQKPDGEDSYDYVRPLATVEPTAIRFGLPVQSAFGYKETDRLTAALLAPERHGATLLIGWEHHKLNEMVPRLLASLGGTVMPPKWQREDFDTIWRVTITRSGAATQAAFAVDHQGLDGQPETCPGPHP